MKIYIKGEEMLKVFAIIGLGAVLITAMQLHAAPYTYTEKYYTPNGKVFKIIQHSGSDYKILDKDGRVLETCKQQNRGTKCVDRNGKTLYTIKTD